MNHKEIKTPARIDVLFDRISDLIERARKKVATTVNIAEVYTKYYIGKYIVEEEQQGEKRAGYGQQILKELSGKLTKKFGKGWGMENLRLIRNFYLVYSNKIQNTVLEINSENQNDVLDFTKTGKNYLNNVDTIQTPRFVLSWSHYLILMRIENPDARSFYEIECAEQQWSVRQLSRQVGSSLYERLALSRNKDEVMRLAQVGQTIEKSSDIIKDPLTLEFLGLKPDVAYTESKLENAIINRLQDYKNANNGTSRQNMP